MMANIICGVQSDHNKTKNLQVCGSIVGSSNFACNLWLLDWIINYLIHLVIEKHKDYYFKFQKSY